MWITSSLTTAKTPTRVALGNFDGVHLGHRQVIQPILEFSDSPLPTLVAVASGYSDWRAPGGIATRGNGDRSPDAKAVPTVVTFFPHPQEYFSGQAQPLLTPLEEKAGQLLQMGVHQLVLLPFNQDLAVLSAEAFVERVLIEGLGVRQISVGSDFRFGKGRQGDVQLLGAIAAHHQIPVTIVPLKHDIEGRISSSRIRQALKTGELDIVKQLLGRPYTLTGRVVGGQQMGRTIGFPTANLKLPPDKFIPRQGVYSVNVYGLAPPCADCQEINDLTPYRGVMNIGTRPTVAGQGLSIEVHIFDWSQDLYDQTLTVSLEKFLRPEQKFTSVENLKAQIQLDCQAALATGDDSIP